MTDPTSRREEIARIIASEIYASEARRAAAGYAPGAYAKPAIAAALAKADAILATDGGREAGWLIEHATEPKWWTGWPGSATDDLFWTTDASVGIRFAREVDARRFAEQYFDDGDYRITEHAWTMGC